MNIAATVTYRCHTCGELIEEGAVILVDQDGEPVDLDTPNIPAGTTSHHAAHLEEAE